MEDKEIEELLERHQVGDLTEIKKKLLDSWYWQYNETLPIQLNVKEIQAAQYEVLQRLPKRVIVKKISWKRVIATAAACIIVFVALGFYLFNKERLLTAHFVNNDIKPGGYKAILILANGTNIDLDEVKDGEIAEDRGVKILKLPDGKLQFKADNDKPVSVNSAIKIDSLPALVAVVKPIKEGGGLNVVLTPKGGQYHIALPDGTNVWINAGSTLRFPSSFDDVAERRVHLTGEAYFEVKQVKSVFGMQKRAGKVPFIVQTDKQEVTVLGTDFNINSYVDEPDIKTTLLEGLVKVSSKKGDVVLKPGMQAVNNGNGLKTANTDVEMAVAWKNGEFAFYKQTLESIMRQVGRWYNVEIAYENQLLRKRTFSGSISKFRNASQVLKMLELAGNVTFKLEYKKITVFN